MYEAYFLKPLFENHPKSMSAQNHTLHKLLSILSRDRFRGTWSHIKVLSNV